MGVMRRGEQSAPIGAVEWLRRHAWIEDHSGWTFDDYDNARAGDILTHEEYHKLIAPEKPEKPAHE